MRATTVLLLLPLWLSAGCASSQMTFERLAEESDPLPAPAELSRPTRLGVEPYRGPHLKLHQRVVQALDQSGVFQEVVDLSQPGRADEPVDFSLRLDFEGSGSGRFYNLFTCFPGFVFFLPDLIRLRWEIDLETRLRLLEGVEEVGDQRRRDRYHLAFTPQGYSILCNLGWASLLFTPMGGFPLGAGIASVFDCPDMGLVTESLSHGVEGDYFARSVVDWATQVIESQRSTRLPGR